MQKPNRIISTNKHIGFFDSDIHDLFKPITRALIKKLEADHEAWVSWRPCTVERDCISGYKRVLIKNITRDGEVFTLTCETFDSPSVRFESRMEKNYALPLLFLMRDEEKLIQLWTRAEGKATYVGKH